MVYYYNLWIIFEKEAVKMTFTNQKHAPSTPVPIPRTGISRVPSILLHLLLCLTAVMIPLGVASVYGAARIPALAVETISIILIVLMAMYFIRTGKLSGKTSRGLLPVLGFITIFFVYMTQSAILATIGLSLIFFIGEGGVLLATQTKKDAVWLPLIPLAALGLSLAVCRGCDVALLCLLPLPATVAMAFGTRSSAAKDTGLTRVGVICLTSFCLGVTVVGFGAWFLYKALGTLEISAIQNLLDGIRLEITDSILNLHLEANGETLYPFEGHEELITDAVNVTFNILPALGVVIINVISALSQMVTLSGLVAFGFASSVTQRVKEFRISTVSSFVFLAAWVVSLVANAEGSTVVGTVAENFTVILLPGMGLAGTLRLIRTLARKGCAPGCLIFLILPVLFFISVNVIFILAGYEAIAAVFGPLVAKLRPPREDPFFPPRQDNPFNHTQDTDVDDEAFDEDDVQDDSDVQDEDDSQDDDNDSHTDGPSLF